MDLSIIIPAHNEEKYITKCLEQIPKEYETIVVCNGCTDKTEEETKKFPVKIISTEKKGVSLARNLGAKAASHNRLVFMDADILITKEILEDIKKTKYTIGAVYLKPDVKNFYSNFYIFFKNLKGEILHRLGGIIFCDKNIFEKTDGFDEDRKYKEDVVFGKKAIKLGNFGMIKKYAQVSMRRFEKAGYIKHIFITPKTWFNKSQDYPTVR